MVLNFNVKHNGIFYPHGTDIPVESLDALFGKPDAGKKVETKVEVKPVVETKVEETVVETNDKKYTKTEINRMSTAELRALAKENGIDGDEYVGSELKTMLIEKLV